MRHGIGDGWLGLGLVGALAMGCGGTDTTGGGGPSGTGPGPGSTSGGSGVSCAVQKADVAMSAAAGTTPVIAWGADHYLVTWTSTAKDQGDIRAVLVDAKGNKGAEQSIHEGPGESKMPAVVRLASGYLVLWQDVAANGSTVWARHVDDSGTPSGSAFQIGTSNNPESRPDAVLAAAGVAVAWQDSTGASVGLVQNDHLAGKSPINQGGYPALGGSGNNLGLVWVTGSKLGVSHLSAPLDPLMPAMFRMAAGKANVPRVAVTGDGTLGVAWEDNRDGDDNETIYFARVDKGDQVGAEVRVPSDKSSANFPDVVWTGDKAAIVYYQFRDGPPGIYLTRVNADGTTESPDLRISGAGVAARFPRMVQAGSSSTLGVVYADKSGPVRMALVTCP